MAETEDVVQGLMDALIEPILPTTLLYGLPYSTAVQESVAKQMHAVVLLYNYYHRKENRRQRFLGFLDFAKLALVLKPALSGFMKQLEGPEDQLSITEKAIKDACDIAAGLDAMTDFPNSEGWPISKIAVLLIDSKRKYFLVQVDVVTRGGWSLIEKHVDECCVVDEFLIEGRCSQNRKRSRRDDPSTDVAAKFLPLAFDAAKEISGVGNENDLHILGTHVTYSISKERSAVLCYVMQFRSSSICCSEQVPLEFPLESLQGPLIEEVVSVTFRTKPIVKHHQMLPYVNIIASLVREKDLPLPHISTNGNDKSKLESSNGVPDFGCLRTGNGVIKMAEGAKSNPKERRVSSSEQLQIALALLYSKIQAKHSEMCDMEDRLALYEDFIARIQDGNDVGLARKCIDAITSGGDLLQLEQREELKHQKRSLLYLPGKSSCEDLEYVCRMNNWRMPRYFVEPLDGKFTAKAIVGAKDVEFSYKGESKMNPRDARESAAARLIAEIRNLRQ